MLTKNLETLLYPYEFCIGGIVWNIVGSGKGLRPKDTFEFLRLDAEIILLFDKAGLGFELRFCLLNFFLFDELIVERLDAFRVPLE